MNDMKCPFCGKSLDAVVKNQNDWIYSCGNPSCEFFNDCDNYEKKHYLATPEFWQELIRTRKALDVAKNGLEYIFGYEGVPKYVAKHVRQVLDQIKNETALEQKD